LRATVPVPGIGRKPLADLSNADLLAIGWGKLQWAAALAGKPPN
jgi:hypothetical protein